MNRFRKIQPLNGSVLIFSLIVLAFMLVSALSLATVSVTEKRASFSTERSSRSFQVADSGVEIILQKIYKGNYSDLNLLAAAAGGSCTGGVISDSLNSGNYEVSFYKNNGMQITDCGSITWRNDAVKIKSEGVSGNTTRAVEVAVKPRLSLDKQKILSLGYSHGCVILQNGNVDCWGDNTNGSATDMTTGNVIALSTWISSTCALQSNGNVDCNADDYFGSDVVMIDEAPNSNDKCALLLNGYVHCWAGGLVDYLVGDAVALDVANGTACAVLQNGNAHCWGLNSDGQAADYNGGNAIDVDISGSLTCFLLSNGNVKCQGSNTYSETLGYSGGKAIGFDVGLARACALLSTGDVDCWGDNAYGKSNDYNGGDAVKVDGWLDHTCVLLSNGNVHCWGDNSDGEATDYTGGDAVAIDTGFHFTCALLSNRNVTCWGRNAAGQSTGHSSGNARLPGE